MASSYKTPNVYVEERSIFPPSVAEVATAIPAFIGRTEIDEDAGGESLVNQSVRITSLVEYESWFGGPFDESFDLESIKDSEGNVIDVKFKKDTLSKMPDFILYQSVAHYFANGGGACYVISIGTPAKYTDVSTEKALFEEAIDVVSQVDEVTLMVLADAAPRFKDSLPEFYGLCNKGLAKCTELKDRFMLIDCVDSLGNDSTSRDNDVKALRDTINNEVDFAKYGAAYYPYLMTTMARAYDESKVTLDDVAMNDPSLQGTEAYSILKNKLAKNYLILPPSSAMAGIYARVDGARGVWKAPANVSVSGIVGPTRIIDNVIQENLNVDTTAGKSINAIRAFTGKGTLVWGARTLAGNDNEWRYVSVRRLFNMVEESIQKSTGFAVFEPNTPFTWLKLKTMIESYLTNLWRQGALFGETPEQAFFVNVGLGQTMTEDDINNGYMRIEIGIAAVRPAEFIVLTFSHKSLEG
ncbi:phage tail sheath family protein [Spartinivicinus poritis]|uniref:Phage tail sheath subtilisin-like domain-containing protein n=1 Tax=Spartinivicinus poritis TaxID=2994640 RepID=A0ABT5UAH9_9GAMM|nr:phage tail sheath C-terminal domain-containing protein [Spartinivicinus sp. A2-2]MDE1462134.1 phage tail sheath subtilisin-like domain-containing protein [Spartinivicinus sp. A2-2]